MKNIYFCTFGNGRFSDSRYRLAEQVRSSGWFKDIFVYGETDLIEYDKTLEGCGAGYWWWKPIIIQKTFEKMQDGDILLYLDAGCTFNPTYKDRFFQYIDYLSYDDFLGFEIGLLEKHWTKRDLFKLLNADFFKYTDTNQIIGGVFFLVKSEKTMNLIDEWKTISFIPHCINDHPSYNHNYPGFTEHRHDQSVLSLLVKKYGGKLLPDETNPIREGYPILATRLC
jgi:hypothetical protein